MKLLPKSVVDASKAKELKRDIDEGLKLARRIDSLREIQAAEEKALTDFRRKTLSAFNADITTANQELDIVKRELKEAKEATAEARKPLDEEREKLNQLRTTLELEKGELGKRSENIANLEKLTLEDSKFAEDNVAASKLALEQARDTFRDASLKNEQANKIVEEAVALQAKTIESEKISLEEQASRNLAIENRERALKAYATQQSIRETELNNREVRLVDREQTLIRNIKRYGANGIRPTTT